MGRRAILSLAVAVFLIVAVAPAFSADFLAGARFWRLDNSISLEPGLLAAASFGQTQSWVDPVLGARFRYNFGKGWYANLIGDAGGFGVGSQLTWQVYTGVGKEFKKKYSVLLGYRYLYVDIPTVDSYMTPT